MDCLEFRRRLGTEPQSRDPELLAHRRACPACAAAWERAQAFEHELQAALDVPVPAGLVERVLLAQATGERRRQTVRRRRVAYALAASVLLALGTGGYAWRQHDARSLPALAVAHMYAPPESHAMDYRPPISAQAIEAGFADRGVQLRGPLPAGVTYVHDCPVGPYKTVHLVSRVDDMPVAVLYVPGKQEPKTRDFHRDGWHGRIVPLQHGTLVMLTNRQGARPFDAIAQGWRLAIDGSGDARVADVPLRPSSLLAP